MDTSTLSVSNMDFFMTLQLEASTRRINDTQIEELALY